MKSESINELAMALSLVQSEVTGAKADSENPHYRAKYADLGSVWETIRGPLTKNNLCVIQTTEIRDEKLGVVTRMIHKSGQWVEGFTPILNDKNNAQGMGSAITYARRYSLAAIVGVYQDDDDAENAVVRKPQYLVPPSKPLLDKPKVDGEYVCTFGKYAKMPITSIAKKELENYVDYIQQGLISSGKKPTASVAEFLEEAKKCLK